MNPFTAIQDLLDEHDYMGPVGAFIGVVIAIGVAYFTRQTQRVALTFQDMCDSLTTQKIKYRINPSEPLSLANNPLKGEPSK